MKRKTRKKQVILILVVLLLLLGVIFYYTGIIPQTFLIEPEITPIKQGLEPIKHYVG